MLCCETSPPKELFIALDTALLQFSGHRQYISRFFARRSGLQPSSQQNLFSPSETCEFSLYYLHFCQHSGLLYSHQNNPLTFQGFSGAKIQGLHYYSHRPTPKACEAHGQICHNSIPNLCVSFLCQLFLIVLFQNIWQNQFKEKVYFNSALGSHASWKARDMVAEYKAASHVASDIRKQKETYGWCFTRFPFYPAQDPAHRTCHPHSPSSLLLVKHVGTYFTAMPRGLSLMWFSISSG